MKLERYKDKKETRKKVMLIGLTVITLVSITMVLYKTFAKFTTTESFQIMSGKVVYKKKGLELGKDIPTSSDNYGGLYKVEHKTSGINSGWNNPEYRYGGYYPSNFVYFNCGDIENQNENTCEKWRIIGLVNVETNSGAIEQRLKIIPNRSLGFYTWDINTNQTSSDWTKAALKDMLNTGFYFSSSSPCYKGVSDSMYNELSQCNFSYDPKGLTPLARDMIDNEVVWNLGGVYDVASQSADAMYQYERGTSVVSGWPTKWTVNNDSSNNHRGVGLMYPSDYGYAVGAYPRDTCLRSTLGSYKNNNCSSNDWIKWNSTTWLLTPITTEASYEWYPWVSAITTDGDVAYTNSASAHHVIPTVYLRSNWKLSDGDGSISNPYKLIS